MYILIWDGVKDFSSRPFPQSLSLIAPRFGIKQEVNDAPKLSHVSSVKLEYYNCARVAVR